MQDNFAGGSATAAAGPAVSVVIPVRNAAETLAETLQSLAGQRFRDFEIIIVDDGSTDDTAKVIETWMRRDARIRTLCQPASGVSIARNNGLAAARGGWVLFLDGDDWITPDYFERMLDAARTHPKAEIVYCGYRRIPPGGAVLPMVFDPQLETDPLKSLAVTCAVCIHSILIRRSLLIEAGGFDTALKTSEDWDLWIRLARMGAQFVAVPEAMALYRIRPGSASRSPVQMAKDYSDVVRRAHGPDPRVKRGPLRYAQGWTGNDVNELCVFNVTYLAAIEAGHGHSGAPVFDTLTTPPDCAGIVPYLPDSIFDGLTLGAGLVPSAITDAIEPYVLEIAARIEALSSGEPVAETIMRETACRILNAQDLTQPKTLWGIHARQLDLAEPIAAFTVPSGVHHLLLRLKFKGRTIEDRYLAVHGPMTSARLAERLLQEMGLEALPDNPLVKELAFIPAFIGMTLGKAWMIWRSRRERKEKYLSLIRTLGGSFASCRNLARAAGGKPASHLACRRNAERLVLQCRTAILGPAMEPAQSVRTAHAALPAVEFPVLMYHRIAAGGPRALAQWRLAPQLFEEQLAFLRREGFTTVTSRELGQAMRSERPLPPRPVMLTFDDAYRDFYDTALPLLQRYGATAELFVVTGRVGLAADWDKAYGPPAPLMGWDEILACSRAGILIGSHMASHRPAPSLDDEALIEEGAVSRYTLEAKLGYPVRSLALPFGDYDERVIEAMALCGYEQVYTCDSALASSHGDALRIPRLEVMGNTDLSSFVEMLGRVPMQEAVPA